MKEEWDRDKDWGRKKKKDLEEGVGRRGEGFGKASQIKGTAAN